MTTGRGLVCRDERRRNELFRQRDRLNGVDFVEVLPGPVLCVHFFGECRRSATPSTPRA